MDLSSIQLFRSTTRTYAFNIILTMYKEHYKEKFQPKKKNSEQFTVSISCIKFDKTIVDYFKQCYQ